MAAFEASPMIVERPKCCRVLTVGFGSLVVGSGR